jgi:PAS domain S-box-containing protein
VRRSDIDGQAGRGTRLPAAPAWFDVLVGAELVLVGVCAEDGTFLDANRLAFEGCGWRREEQLGRPFWETGWWSGSAEVRAQVRRWCAEVAAGGPPVRAVTSYWLADGTRRTVDFTLQRVRDPLTGAHHLFPNGMDITDRAAATRAAAEAETLRQVAAARAADLEALRRAEAELSRTLWVTERVLANVADGIYGLDAAGRVEFVNPAAARATGIPAAAQLGHDQHALIHGRRADGTAYPVEECPVWRALRSGRTVTADDEVFWRPDGTAVPVELVAVPTVEAGRAGGDTVTGVVVSFRDLTARRAAEAQAAELRLLEQQAAAQRALTDRLQQALLTPPPEPDHLHVVVRYRPAAHEAQVGGDWYDAFLQPDGATMLVIGDVAGHDSGAAAAMGQLRGLLRALAYDNDEPLGATLARVDRTARGLGVDSLATAVLARVERHPDVPVTGRRVLRWSNAGHPQPVVLAPDGTTTLLGERPDLLLGVDPTAPRHDLTADLEDGCTLLLYTDGLVEHRGRDLDEGTAALRAALADLGTAPLDELCDTLLARLVPTARGDDVALLAVRAYPEDRPRPPEAGPRRLPPGLS